MGWIVVTTDGEPARYQREKDGTCPWTEERARLEADDANREAERLGIKTRYDIKDED